MRVLFRPVRGEAHAWGTVVTITNNIPASVAGSDDASGTVQVHAANVSLYSLTIENTYGKVRNVFLPYIDIVLTLACSLSSSRRQSLSVLRMDNSVGTRSNSPEISEWELARSLLGGDGNVSSETRFSQIRAREYDYT